MMIISLFDLNLNLGSHSEEDARALAVYSFLIELQELQCEHVDTQKKVISTCRKELRELRGFTILLTQQTHNSDYNGRR